MPADQAGNAPWSVAQERLARDVWRMARLINPVKEVHYVVVIDCFL